MVTLTMVLLCTGYVATMAGALTLPFDRPDQPGMSRVAVAELRTAYARSRLLLIGGVAKLAVGAMVLWMGVLP